MHIAICMDVAADRKQLERLLGRSTDRRLSEDISVPFYIQSYGNKEALLARPFMYDLFFINILNDSISSDQLIRQLRELGVTADICYCPNLDDFSNRLSPLDNVHILKQPIIAAELEEIMDIAVGHVKEKVPTLDIRLTTDTIRIEEKQLLYAHKVKDKIMVHLSDGRVMESPERIEVFYERARVAFGKIVFIPGKIGSMVVAARAEEILEVNRNSVTLTDGQKVRISSKLAKRLSEYIGMLDGND